MTENNIDGNIANNETEAVTEPAWTPPASQDDLNRIISERLTRQAAKFSDYDELKQQASELAEIKNSQMSELDRERAAREAAETRANERIQAADQRLIRAELIAEANKAGAVDIDTVAALLPADAITITENGEVVGAAEAIGKLLEAKPFLAAAPTPAPAGGAPANPAKDRSNGVITDEASLAAMSQTEIAAALADGRLDGLL